VRIPKILFFVFTIASSGQQPPAGDPPARWRGENNSPAAGSDGRVLYSFGAGLPTVVCAPLRVCMIELQAGEKTSASRT
jgi:hypothetical protein